MEITNINEFVSDFIFQLKNNYSEENIKNTLYIMLYKKSENNCTDLVVQCDNDNLIRKFVVCKKIEGLSERSIKVYVYNLGHFYKFIQKDFLQITTDDVRYYLAVNIQKKVSEQTILHRKRTLSTFYSFLEQEGLVVKNPVTAIKTIKTKKQVKEPVEDLDIEKIRDYSMPTRNRAIFEMLMSTGMRVSELCSLNTNDIDFKNSQCIVLGKGNKERVCFLNARAVYWIQKYLAERTDKDKALFVSELKPHNRIEISCVEIFLRKIGRDLGINLHPHKLRRTVATEAITRGMPIEQIQIMLGHNSISTTTEYAITKVQDVKYNHSRLLQ